MEVHGKTANEINGNIQWKIAQTAKGQFKDIRIRKMPSIKFLKAFLCMPDTILSQKLHQPYE